jgi:hypothetical protein
MPLTFEVASRFAQIVLAGAEREYPHKLDHVMNSTAEVLPPRRLHPAFYGCFDWHSAVHGHWLMVRLLRLMAELPEAEAMRRILDEHLTVDNIASEVEYLQRPNSGSFERTYGWAWLLKLAEEAGRGDRDGLPGAGAWAAALAPLAEVFVARYMGYLPRAEYPIRTGVHANSAFGLAFAHDWAMWAEDDALRQVVEHKSRAFYESDERYPAHLEPSGADFFSPALMEAELMRRVLGAEEFAAWFGRFLPEAGERRPRELFEAASVSDRGDLQIVHLDGLNLSRAWCMRGMARALAGEGATIGPRVVEQLEDSAARHLAAALPHVSSGDYAGEHWLATFAVLAMTGA